MYKFMDRVIIEQGFYAGTSFYIVGLHKVEGTNYYNLIPTSSRVPTSAALTIAKELFNEKLLKLDNTKELT